MSRNNSNIKYLIIFFLVLECVVDIFIIENLFIAFIAYCFGVVMLFSSNMFMWFDKNEISNSNYIFINSLTSRMMIAIGTYSGMKISIMAPLVLAMHKNIYGKIFEITNFDNKLLILLILPAILYHGIVIVCGYDAFILIKRKTHGVFKQELNLFAKFFIYALYTILVLSFIVLFLYMKSGGGNFTR